MKRTAKIVLGLVAAGSLAVLGIVFLGFSSGREESAKHVNHIDWLPTEASDVTYAKRDGFGWFTCYECYMPKEALERMAQKEGWKLELKSDVHTSLRTVLDLPPLKRTEFGEIDSVAKAMFYERRHPNGGGITVIYDLDTSRLFVHESHR